MNRPEPFKVLVNYSRRGASVSQILYQGPHRKHADNAYNAACTLGRHGVLKGTVRFFDGYRLRSDFEQMYTGEAE